MNILMICPRYLPLLGGVETHSYEVGKRMAALGHMVQVLTTDPSGDLPAQETQDGVPIKRVKAYPKNKDYYLAPQIYYEIARARRNGFDIIHFQGWNTFVPILGMIAAIRFSMPYVLTFHSGGHPSRLRNAIRPLQQKLLSPLVARASQLIGVSEFEADLMATNMGLARDRFVVIRNGVWLPAPNPEPATDPHLIMSIGRLERYKGHHRAIEAMPHLLRRIPDARLLVVGSGPYEASLRALVRTLKVDGKVSFVSIPPTERQQFSNVVHTAGLVVLLSEYEANPVSVMEALAARRRVLVSYTTGLRELADAGWCRSVRTQTRPSGIAEAIATELASDRQQTAPFLEHDWDDCARQLLSVYDAVLRSRSSLQTVETLS
jgi:glycosyltransferase involved in cell wall biosynthesis